MTSSSKTRRRLLSAIALLLVLGNMRFAAYAQGGAPKVTVSIDGQRNAVMQVESQEKSHDNSSGTVKGGVDLGGGLGVLDMNIDLSPTAAQNMKGTKVVTFGQMDANATTVVGNLHIPLPPEAQSAKVDASAKLQQNDKNVHVEADVKATIPNKGPAPITHFGVEASSKTDYKTWNSTTKIDVTSPSMSQVPLKSLNINIAEPDNKSSDIEVAVVLDLTNPNATPLRAQLEQLKANPKNVEEMIKSQASRAKINVESVAIKADINGNDGTLNIKLKVIDLRATIAAGVNDLISMTQGGADPAVVKKSVDDMLQLVFTKLTIAAEVKGEALTVNVTIDAKNFDKFISGYTALVTNINEASFKRMQASKGMDRAAELGLRWWHAVQTRIDEISRASMEETAKNNVQMVQNLKVNVDIKDQQVTIDGKYLQDSNNFDKVFAALKAKGFPMADGGGLDLKVKTENNAVTGTLYIGARGNLPQIAKSILVDPAKGHPELKPAADLLSGLTWEDGRFLVSVTDAKVAVLAFSKTSDLSPIVTAVQTVALPSLQGAPTGLRFDINIKDNMANTNAKIGFKNFMAGKSNDDVKQLISGWFPGSDVTVADASDPKTIELVVLEKKTIEMPGDLTAIKTSGEGTVANVPAPSAVAPGGGSLPGTGPGGMNTGVLIGIGVAVLALLGIVMASAGKKK